MERVTGIEPALSAWKAEVLPLNHTRDLQRKLLYRKLPHRGETFLEEAICPHAKPHAEQPSLDAPQPDSHRRAQSLATRAARPYSWAMRIIFRIRSASSSQQGKSSPRSAFFAIIASGSTAFSTQVTPEISSPAAA